MSQGGKREGAGRPTKDGIGRKRLTVALREDILAELTREAKALDCSLADRVNALLSQQLAKKADPVSGPIDKTPDTRREPAPVLGTTIEAKRLSGPDETEPIPSYRELDELVRRCLNRSSSVNRRSQQIQYWRKAYRKEKAFREALDRVAGKTHPGLRDLLLDNHLPLGSHKEVLALADMPIDALKLTIARLLRGERSLKLALGSATETFRQIVTEQVRQSDKLFTNYYFFEEL